MTITGTTFHVQYDGDGAEDTFSYPFPIYDEEHLGVVVKDTTDDSEALLVLNTDYTVTDVNDPDGGTIVCTTPPTSDEIISIMRVVPQEQDVDLVSQGTYPPDSMERGLDLITMMLHTLWGGSYTTATRPEPNQNWDFKMIGLQDVSGPGMLQMCLANADDTRGWVTIYSGMP